MFVDADAHVHECEETWSYLPKEFARLAPSTISVDPEEAPWLKGENGHASRNRFWFIEGQLYPRHLTNDERTGTTIGTRTLADVPARLAHMDVLGIDVHVIYPSLLLSEVTQRPELEVALYRSYNRWIAERSATSGERLRWVAMIPYASLAEALEEVRFAKKNGACGIFKRGIELDRAASDPYFFPIYALAEELDLPVCIHKGFRWAPVSHHIPQVRPPGLFGYDELSAFAALRTERVSERFPKLRFGFIECGSAWLPHLLGPDGGRERGQTLAGMSFFVSCDLAEDVPYLLGVIGDDDHLFVYTDYGHGGGEREAHRRFVAREDVNPDSRMKLTSENAKAFYRL